jgi:DNA polymerase-4
VSYNKFLAKLASDQNKPDGLFVITPAEGPAFVEALPVGRFHGIGPATEARMHRLGILTGADLGDTSLAFLSSTSARQGRTTSRSPAASTTGRCRRTGSASRSGRRTPSRATCSLRGDAGRAPAPGRQGLGLVRAERRSGRTVTLKVKYADFRQITRSRSLAEAVADRATLEQVSLDLLAPLCRSTRACACSASPCRLSAPPSRPADLSRSSPWLYRAARWRCSFASIGTEPFAHMSGHTAGLGRSRRDARGCSAGAARAREAVRA